MNSDEPATNQPAEDGAATTEPSTKHHNVASEGSATADVSNAEARRSVAGNAEDENDYASILPTTTTTTTNVALDWPVLEAEVRQLLGPPAPGDVTMTPFLTSLETHAALWCSLRVFR
ncbi:hypothetical protein PPROV_000073000 [Pycnococcus provasolii]|uniref:Uncharacterized protein n=1 Tax=Pycnococcus provasolii TaxID=41880 RepID=A0A830H4K7_9CHLO|nr:hypothetical protein PPROV_000073000 [Pycnococcus provasolii]